MIIYKYINYNVNDGREGLEMLDIMKVIKKDHKKLIWINIMLIQKLFQKEKDNAIMIKSRLRFKFS